MTWTTSRATTLSQRSHGPMTAGSSNWQLRILPDRETRPQPTAAARVIERHQQLVDRYVSLTFRAPEIAAVVRPGQFIMLTAARLGEAIPALPRPMAVYSVEREHGAVEVLYGVVGHGTRRLRTFEVGDRIEVVGPLGRPFDIGDDISRVLLMGRGIGTCSLTLAAAETTRRSITTTAVTSGRSPKTIIGGDLLRRLGCAEVYEVSDADYSSDPDNLFQLLTERHDSAPPDLLMTCGSSRLLRLCESLAHRWGAQVQVSVEAHMACGLGYCHGCASGARSTGDESPLICLDGPVFEWHPNDEAMS